MRHVPVPAKKVIAFLHGVSVDRHIRALEGFQPHDCGSTAFALAHIEFTIGASSGSFGLHPGIGSAAAMP